MLKIPGQVKKSSFSFAGLRSKYGKKVQARRNKYRNNVMGGKRCIPPQKNGHLYRVKDYFKETSH